MPVRNLEICEIILPKSYNLIYSISDDISNLKEFGLKILDTCIKNTIILIGSKYRTFFVLEYPIVEAYKILVPKIENNPILEGNVQPSQAYKDLEKEIKGIN